MTELKTVSGIRVRTPEQDELDGLGVFSWPVWTKEVSEFDWHYDEQETCYFLAGEVIVRTADGEVRIGKGKLVTFPAGLSCRWVITCEVRKHYRFES